MVHCLNGSPEAIRRLVELWTEGETMTGNESRSLSVGARVFWNADKNDAGTITEKDWSGLTVKWDNRDRQRIMHNDMSAVTTAAAASSKSG